MADINAKTTVWNPSITTNPDVAAVTDGFSTDVLKTQTVVDDRKRALEQYPHLADKVSIDGNGITIHTDTAGDVAFWLIPNHDLEIGYDTIKNQPFSREQIKAVIDTLGQGSWPYKDILGLEATYTYGARNRNKSRSKKYCISEATWGRVQAGTFWVLEVGTYWVSIEWAAVWNGIWYGGFTESV